MKEIDKTKDNIGVDGLDEKTRKKLFDEFKSAGGEVISERQKRRNFAIDREKQMTYRERLDEHHRRARTSPLYAGERTGSSANGSSSKKTSSTPSAPALPEGALLSAMNRLRLRFHLWSMHISRFSGFYFHARFLERFSGSYKPALLETQIQYLDLFRKNPNTGNRIMQRLDKMKPLYYELIEMMGNVYDKMMLDQITEHYANFPDVPKKMSELKEPLMEIYRRLYMLRSYENTLFNSFLKAIDMQQSMDEKKSQNASAKKKRIKNSLFVIFHKLYPRLHWLLCYYEGRYITIDSREVEELLHIIASEMPGNRVVRSSDPYEGFVQDRSSPGEEAGAKKEEKKETTPTVPDEVKKGLKMMYVLDMQEMRRLFDSRGVFEFMSDNDKVLMTFLLYHEFEREYAFLLTTNKIKFNIDFNEGGKFNFGTRLQDLYDEMRKPSDGLRDYAETFATYEKVRREKPINNNQYIAYTKRLQEMQKKRDQSGKMARMHVKAYMEKLSEELSVLLEDMNTKQEYVQNPQDVLRLDNTIEGQKKLNGRKIYEAIQLLYYYSSAFVYRLGQKGDLSAALNTPARTRTG